MHMRTMVGRFFVFVAASLLVVLPVAPAFASDTVITSYTTRNVAGITPSAEDAASYGESEDGMLQGDRADENGIMTLSLDELEETPGIDLQSADDPAVLAPPEEDPGAPMVAEREQTGPKTLDSSKEAISQAATHIATPERALTAKDATVAVGDPSASANLKQTGDSLLEGAVIALGSIVIVALCLLVYRFRKA